MLLVAMPGAPSSFLFLVAIHNARYILVRSNLGHVTVGVPVGVDIPSELARERDSTCRNKSSFIA